MNSGQLLTQAFFDRQPVSAARAVAPMEPDDAAALLLELPVRVAAPVVSILPAIAASSCMERMAPQQAAAILRSIGYQDATSILRLIETDLRTHILTELPTALARDFRNTLRYPKEAVGAWMDHDMPSFQGQSTVSEALRIVRQRRQSLETHIFVVDADDRFTGSLSIGGLLRAERSATLESVQRADMLPLSNRALLTSVAADPAWDAYPILPVVGRRQNVLGGLSRSSLRNALATLHSADDPVRATSVVTHMVAGYIATAVGILRLLSPPDQAEMSISNGKSAHG